MKRCAVFSCLGLGDGLIALVLANNLQLNGFPVTTFHPFLNQLQQWFPHLPIRPFPKIEELKEYDRFFIIYEKSTWMQEILSHCEKFYPEKTTVLNPIATMHRDYPYWAEGRFEGDRSFVDNLYFFCKEILKLPIVTKSNGIVIPDRWEKKRFEKRVVLHPMSSRAGKNWPQEKFLTFAEKLKKEGYEPAFILTAQERMGWNLTETEAPLLQDLSAMAGFICESGLMVGNCSGIGHLASCLGLKTVTICRSQQITQFWRPGWTEGTIIAPSPWIPNLKGLRLRDQHWKKWISVDRVVKAAITLASI